MCFLPDQNAASQHAADARFAGKMNALKGREALWHSKGAHSIISLDANKRQYNANLSNIRRQALYIHGRALKAEEGLATAWATKTGTERDIKTGESRARGAGRNKRLEILRAMAATRAAVDHTWREKADSMEHMAKINYQKGRASIRASQGLPPSHYETLNFRPADERGGSRFLRSAMFAIKTAGQIATLGSGLGSIQGGNWEKGLETLSGLA